MTVIGQDLDGGLLMKYYRGRKQMVLPVEKFNRALAQLSEAEYKKLKSAY